MRKKCSLLSVIFSFPQFATMRRQSLLTMTSAVLVGWLIVSNVSVDLVFNDVREMPTDDNDNDDNTSSARTEENGNSSFLRNEQVLEGTIRTANSNSMSCSSKPRPPPFDPFVNLTYSAPARDSMPAYSSFHCVGTGTRDAKLQTDADSVNGHRPNYASRSCWYRNLYYRHRDQTFHYFASPIESTLWTEARKPGNASFAEISSDKMGVSMGHLDDMISADNMLNRMKIAPWRPEVHENVATPPIANFSVVGPEKTTFLLYQPYHSRNIGHFIWDDLLSLFSLLDLFGVTQDEGATHVPLFVERTEKLKSGGVKPFGGSDPFYRCSPWNWRKWNDCVKVYRRHLEVLIGIRPDCSGDILRTGNWLRGEDAIGVWNTHPKEVCTDRAPERTNQNLPPPNTEYVLLQNSMAGTGRLNFFGCEGDCSVGRGPQFFRFRRFLLDKLFGPKESCEIAEKGPIGYITFSVPVGSTRSHLVSMFDEEIKLAKAKYGEEVVRVVDMATISMREQAALVANSAVLLTNHGGGGVASVFLPAGASVIIYWHGASRRDINFYESAGYFRPVWLSKHERPYLNRTMALIEREVEKTALRYPGIISAQGLGRKEVEEQ
jgi:hypothetical protein